MGAGIRSGGSALPSLLLLAVILREDKVCDVTTGIVIMSVLSRVLRFVDSA
jgi:hypothetical protein